MFNQALFPVKYVVFELYPKGYMHIYASLTCRFIIMFRLIIQWRVWNSHAKESHARARQTVIALSILKQFETKCYCRVSSFG